MQAAEDGWRACAPASLRLSVVVPTYNYAALLPRCLDSVLDQLTDECELIVVDDGSADGTADLLRGWNCATRRAAFVLQDNRGPAAARNAGLDASSGRWLLFLDADDVMEVGAIAAILARLGEQPDIDLLLGAHLDYAADGVRRYHAPEAVADAVPVRLEDFLFRKRFGICHGSSVFSRAQIARRRYPEGLRHGEDLAVFAFMLTTPVVATLDVPLVRIYKHADSLRHRFDLNAEHSERIVQAVFEHLPASFQPRINAFRAQRQLSLFRSCYRAGRYAEALLCYRQAWALDARLACRWRYLSKWLRLRLSRLPREAS